MQEEFNYSKPNQPYQRQNSLAKSQIIHQQEQYTKHIEKTAAKKQPIQTHTVVQPQKDDSIFSIFKCCTDVEIQPEYDLNMFKNRKEVSKVSFKSSEPYISTIRMKNRQSQPISVFNDHLVSQKLTKSRWYNE